MGLSEEASQMVRGGFEPGTFRSPVHNFAIVTTPQQFEDTVGHQTVLILSADLKVVCTAFQFSSSSSAGDMFTLHYCRRLGDDSQIT